MENLAIEISKVLNITAEKAVELLPLIKSQFVNYSIVNNTSGWLAFLGLMLAISIIISVVIYLYNFNYMGYEDDMYKEEEDTALLLRKIIPMLATSFVVVAFLIFAFDISKYLLAPDFMLIKKFLG